MSISKYKATTKTTKIGKNRKNFLKLKCELFVRSFVRSFCSVPLVLLVCVCVCLNRFCIKNYFFFSVWYSLAVPFIYIHSFIFICRFWIWFFFSVLLTFQYAQQSVFSFKIFAFTTRCAEISCKCVHVTHVFFLWSSTSNSQAIIGIAI